MPWRHFELLMRHHAWLAERLLDTAALLSPDELDEPSPSHGTLLTTLRHIADVDQSWGRTARGEQVLSPQELEAATPDLAALRAFWLAEAAGLVEFAVGQADADLERPVRPAWKRVDYSAAQILQHISNHAAEHGNEVGWRLSELGHSPGELAFMGFVDLDRRRADT
jgi:uncharacterized damage-inducible protein DinB